MPTFEVEAMAGPCEKIDNSTEWRFSATSLCSANFISRKNGKRLARERFALTDTVQERLRLGRSAGSMDMAVLGAIKGVRNFATEGTAHLMSSISNDATWLGSDIDANCNSCRESRLNGWRCVVEGAELAKQGHFRPWDGR